MLFFSLFNDLIGQGQEKGGHEKRSQPSCMYHPRARFVTTNEVEEKCKVGNELVIFYEQIQYVEEEWAT
jgi:hypothetical protein